MRRFSLLVLTVLMLIVFANPAAAFFEPEFGGYWRNRAFVQKDFSGNQDNNDPDTSRVDMRTRLFFTAHFTENFKFVNKFEMDAVFGDESENSFGDIGTDGVAVEVKNSYADFSFGRWNFKLGAQPKIIARSFIFDDDFAGAIVRYVGDDFLFPFIWIRAYEGGPGSNHDDGDVDYFVLDPRFKVGESTWLNPVAMWITSNDAQGFSGTTGNEEIDVGYFGVNADFEFDWASLWLTAFYEYGNADTIYGDSLDVRGWLGAIGGSVKVDPVDIHGQFFYATGDDDPDDEDFDAFFVPKGGMYYWAEIMGLGVFDNQPSAGSPGDQISNIMAGNVGVTYLATEKLEVTLDYWYAELAEDNDDGNSVLGSEFDLTLTYKLMENLNLDVVGAYLFAGSATAYTGEKNNEDPYEIGTRLWFRF